MAKPNTKTSKHKTQNAARPIRRKPTLDFSVTGLIYCTMMMFIGLAAINTQINMLFGVFGLMIGILVVSFLISGFVIRRLTVERVLPDHAMVGTPAFIYYHVTNRKRFWSSLSVTVTEIDAEMFTRQPSAYMLHVANKMTTIVPAEVTPRRRGVFALDRYQLSTSFPFGFVKRAVDRRQQDKLVVMPPIGRMRRELMRQFRSADSQGDNVRPSRGGNDEFYGLKPYREGENPRMIYWKRSARTGSLVVKEMTRVSPPKVLVLIDTYAVDPTPQRLTEIERAIAMAATLIDHTLAEGLPVGLIAWTGDWVTVVPARGKRHRLDLLTHLASLPPNAEQNHAALLERARPLCDSDTTAVVLSTEDIAMTRIPGVRGGIVPIRAHEEGKRYFTFAESVDFAAE